MKLITEVDSNKIRGGFYTPPALVDTCLSRLKSLIDIERPAHFLEPSSGDGAFIRGISRMRTGKPSITCIELIESEAARCDQEIGRLGLTGSVVHDSFFAWASQSKQKFDAFVGNPPFIRYQFVPPEDRSLAEFMMRLKGFELQGVSNYWIPFVILGLEFLREGGAFSIVLPAEIFSTISGGQVRSYLIGHFESLRVDLYPRDTFPDILQDVLVVSGVRSAKAKKNRIVTFSETIKGVAREWSHDISDATESWKRYLLTRDEWDAFTTAKSLAGFSQLKDLATIGVAIVTGANDFFTVDDATLEEFDLKRWARPLLARTSDSPGVIFESADHAAARSSGNKAWILDFAEGRPDPLAFKLPKRYIEMGISQELNARFKCRIRTPWYRVPGLVSGKLMITKRSHQHHRLILNKPAVFTTDTIYRGQLKALHAGREAEIVACFHNSLTLLSAELEGRSYGGGVLELVPSEVGRLITPLIAASDHIVELDKISRNSGGQLDQNGRLIDATDQILSKMVPGYSKVLERLSFARAKLRDRRFSG